jgi:hypothetical protein
VLEIVATDAPDAAHGITAAFPDDGKRSLGRKRGNVGGVHVTVSLLLR